jgi:hypothetical protein
MDKNCLTENVEHELKVIEESVWWLICVIRVFAPPPRQLKSLKLKS